MKRDESVKIMLEDVLFIRQDLRDVKINTDAGTFVKKGKLFDMLEKLNSNFYACHSYLVINLSRVTMMKDGNIHFDDGKVQHLGKNYYAKTKKVFDAYLNKL